jgi:ribose 5-phosphate isomerase B
MTSPVIALAADHAGFTLKNSMKAVLDEHSFPLVDLGPETADPVDYPGHRRQAGGRAQGWPRAAGAAGVRHGIGIAIAANRYPWVRAAVCHDVTAARLAREHNDANVLALGARLIGPEVARDCLLTFLQTPFAGGRHARRGQDVVTRATACALDPRTGIRACVQRLP